MAGGMTVSAARQLGMHRATLHRHLVLAKATPEGSDSGAVILLLSVGGSDHV